MGFGLMYDYYKVCFCGGTLSDQYYKGKCLKCGSNNKDYNIEDMDMDDETKQYFDQVVEILWDDYATVVASMNRVGFVPYKKYHIKGVSMAEFRWLPEGVTRKDILNATGEDLEVYLKYEKVIPFHYMMRLLFVYWHDVNKDLEKNDGSSWPRDKKKKPKHTEVEEYKIKELLAIIKQIQEVYEADCLEEIDPKHIEYASWYIENQEAIDKEYKIAVEKRGSWYFVGSLPLLYKKACT